MEKDNLRYEILTPDGFCSFSGIRKVLKDHYVEITFKDGSTLKCSEGHKLYDPNGTVRRALTLQPGQEVWGTPNKVVETIHIHYSPIWLYDALEVKDNHKYFTNGLVSSNCDASFLTSGDTFFDQEDMLFYEETYAQDPVERRGIDSNLWIWEYPDYTKSYAISADVARGDGQDYSTFVVWDVETATQVAEYKGQIGPKDFGAVLCGIATEYNGALLSVENANIGWSTVEEILSRGYNNLYYSSNTFQDSVEAYMHKSETGKLVPGFTISPKNRPLLLSTFYDYIHQRAVIIRSKRLLQEMRTFVWTNGKAQAAQGCHDDLVMATGQGLYIRDTALKLRQQGLDLTRASIGAFGNLNKKEAAVVSTTFLRQGDNPYAIQDPFGHAQDISWVLK